MRGRQAAEQVRQTLIAATKTAAVVVAIYAAGCSDDQRAVTLPQPILGSDAGPDGAGGGRGAGGIGGTGSRPVSPNCPPYVVETVPFTPNVPSIVGNKPDGRVVGVGCPSTDGGLAFTPGHVLPTTDASVRFVPTTSDSLRWNPGDTPENMWCRILCGIDCGPDGGTECGPDAGFRNTRILGCSITLDAQALPPTCAPDHVMCTMQTQKTCFL